MSHSDVGKGFGCSYRRFKRRFGVVCFVHGGLWQGVHAFGVLVCRYWLMCAPCQMRKGLVCCVSSKSLGFRVWGLAWNVKGTLVAMPV